MPSQWMTHKGQKIYWADFAHKEVEGLRAEMDRVTAVLKQQPLNSMLYLSDSRGTIITPPVLALLRERGKEAEPYVRRMAVLGIDGAVRRSMFDMVMKFIGPKSPTKTFDDETAALDWLAS